MGFAKIRSRRGRSPDLRVAWVGVTSPTAFVAACGSRRRVMGRRSRAVGGVASTYEGRITSCRRRSEEHTSELQSLMRISYAVFCLKKKNEHKNITTEDN